MTQRRAPVTIFRFLHVEERVLGGPRGLTRVGGVYGERKEALAKVWCVAERHTEAEKGN